ncbi:NAD-dependent epimerase/dehydratase family protein [Methylomonas sp. MgM2]
MRYVLVTGAHGFIGQRLCSLLRARGIKVRTLGHRSTGNETDAFKMDFIYDNCPKNLCSGIDTIFHLAGKAHAVAERPSNNREFRQINVEGTRKILEAAKRAGVKQFVFFSSVKAVGDCNDQAVDESVTTFAHTSYGRSKFEAEQLVLYGGYVPHPVVIRPCMVYGESNKGNLPRMIKAIKFGLFPPLPNFNNRRSMVHVEDVARAAILTAEKPEAKGQVYIVTDGQSYSTRQIYDWIREGLGKPPVRWEIPIGLLKASAKIGDIIGCVIHRRFPFDSTALQKLSGSAWYSSVKIEQELDFHPSCTLQRSLPDIIRFLNPK